jgi:CheY-like chemotaxis protein
MKTVLLVDDESRLLTSIRMGLKAYFDHFSLLTAANGREAMDILSARPVDLVVTDLRMPEVDGFALLSHISGNYPFLPTIVMTAFSCPEIEERVDGAGSLILLEKPLDFGRLAEAILDGLARSEKEGSITGFSLASFMQLLAGERKTCLLQVEGASGGDGLVYFEEGDPFAAVAGDLRGEEAIHALLLLDHVRLTFGRTPTRKVRRTIFTPLMHLLLEGMQRRDERDSHVSQTPQAEEGGGDGSFSEPCC